MTEEELELLKAQVAATITNNKSGSNWSFADSGYETSGFSYAYCYKKSKGVGTEPGKLSITGDGLLSITFDVFVGSATDGVGFVFVSLF